MRRSRIPLLRHRRHAIRRRTDVVSVSVFDPFHWSPHVNAASLITPREITTRYDGDRWLRRLAIVRPGNAGRTDTLKRIVDKYWLMYSECGVNVHSRHFSFLEWKISLSRVGENFSTVLSWPKPENLSCDRSESFKHFGCLHSIMHVH